MKSLIITGGTGDLGRVVLPQLARDFDCVAVYRSIAAWSRVPPIENVQGAESLARALELAPAPHAFVHLAGGFTAGSATADYTKMFETNVLPLVEALAAIAPHLADGGRVVAISAAASLSTPPGIGAYVASKAALNAVILTAASELKSRRITANALLPTSIGADAVPPEHIAGAIAFLLSDGGAEVSGQLIVMKG
jgi:NAD(P)-dependent dehydrogenase (short-subunit alcohol dehydrogenase family)